MTRDQQTLLTDYLKAGAARCPTCRYDLRGTESDTCPECGTVLHLQLAAHSGTRTFDWWFAILGAAITLLMTLAFLGRVSDKVIKTALDPALPQMVRMGFASTSDLPDWSLMFTAVFICTIAASLFAFLLGSRARWTPWPRAARWSIAGGAAAAPLIYMAFLYLWVGT